MKTKKVKVSDFFTKKEIGPSIQGLDLDGKTLILDPNVLQKAFQTRDNCLWKATGGFGCSPSSMGRAVFAENVKDGRMARWNRGDFVAIYTGE